MNETMISRAFFFFLACFFLGAVYLSFERSLCETLEAESALIARAYVTGQAHFVNQLNGQEDLDKPPLYYWMIAGFSLFSPNWEVAARLPSIVALLLFLLLLFKMSRTSNRTHLFFFLWSVMFLFCPKILWMSQVARMDLIFSAWCFTALCFFIIGAGLLNNDKSSNRMSHVIKGKYLAGLFVSTAIAVMIKGPLGAILVLSPIILFVLLERRFNLLRQLFLSPYFLLFLVLCLPWYVFVTLKTDFRFFHRFILEENLARFTNLLPGDLKEFNHSPPTRYITYFLVGFFPWSLMVPLWMIHFVKRWKELEPFTKLLFIYFIFVFLFFSLAISKRSDYILPLYPAAAFLGTEFILGAGKPLVFPRLIRLVTSIFLATFTLLALAGLFSHFFDAPSVLATTFSIKKSALTSFMLAILKEQTLLFLFLALASLLTLLYVSRPSIKDKPGALFTCFNLLAGLVVASVMLFTLPSIYKGKDARPFCKKVERIVGKSPLFFGGFWDEECSFYLNRRIMRIDINEAADIFRERHKQVYLILDGKRSRRLKVKGIDFPFKYEDKSLVLRTLILVSNI